MIGQGIKSHPSVCDVHQACPCSGLVETALGHKVTAAALHCSYEPVRADELNPTNAPPVPPPR